jgi:5-methylcytosine-specific restriction endonuclease McrA
MALQRLNTARVPTLDTRRLPVLEAKAGTTQRIRGDTWMSIRRKVLQRDGYACQCCGIVRRDNEVDHRIPLEQGGSNELDNLQTLCGGPDGCHTRKTKAEAQGRGGIKV